MRSPAALDVGCPACGASMTLSTFTGAARPDLAHSTATCPGCATVALVTVTITAFTSARPRTKAPRLRERIERDMSAPFAALIDEIDAYHGTFIAMDACRPNRATRAQIRSTAGGAA